MLTSDPRNQSGAADAAPTRPLRAGALLLTPDGFLHSPTASVHLSRRFATLLGVLILANGEAVSKQDLLTRCWGNRRSSVTNLAKAISGLRRILAISGAPSIQTVYGHGYRLVPVAGSVHVRTRCERAVAICTEAERRARNDTRGGLQTTIHHFELALQQDADLVDAHIGLARAHLLSMQLGYSSPRSTWGEVSLGLERALQLRPDSADAHALRGLGLSIAAWDYPAATSALATSRRLAPYGFLPNDCTGRHYLGCGRFIRAIEHFEAATEAVPVATASLSLLAYSLMCAREVVAAREKAAQAVSIEPDSGVALAFRCWIESTVGDPAAAVTFGTEARKRLPDAPAITLMLAYSLARALQPTAARELLHESARVERFPYGCSSLASVAWLELREPAKAIAALERGYEENCCWLTMMLHDPRITALHGQVALERLCQTLPVQGDEGPS